MDNKVETKRFPWGWVAAGCGVVAIGVVALVVFAVAALMVIPTLRSSSAGQSPLQVPLPAPSIGATAVPNATPGSATTEGNLPFTFSAVNAQTGIPNQSLMDQMVSSLNLNNNSDFMAPKTYKGTAYLDPSTPFTLGNGWCAKDATTLKQNLANMQWQFSINGTNIDLSQYPTLTFSDNQGNACAMTGISITPTGNPGGTYQVVLTQKYTSKLEDGLTASPYPAGDVTFNFSIQFRTAPNPGSGA